MEMTSLQDYGYDPHRMRVYETRPISALSEMSDTGLHNTWKRTYVVQKPDEVRYRGLNARS